MRVVYLMVWGWGQFVCRVHCGGWRGPEGMPAVWGWSSCWTRRGLRWLLAVPPLLFGLSFSLAPFFLCAAGGWGQSLAWLWLCENGGFVCGREGHEAFVQGGWLGCELLLCSYPFPPHKALIHYGPLGKDSLFARLSAVG